MHEHPISPPTTHTSKCNFSSEIRGMWSLTHSNILSDSQCIMTSRTDRSNLKVLRLRRYLKQPIGWDEWCKRFHPRAYFKEYISTNTQISILGEKSVRPGDGGHYTPPLVVAWLHWGPWDTPVSWRPWEYNAMLAHKLVQQILQKYSINHTSKESSLTHLSFQW